MEFLDNRLHNLKDKPKFFFFIACRTEEQDLIEEQDDMMVATIQTDGPIRPVPEVDHLVCSSTVDTYSSFRCTQHGSFYVQILCDQLMKYGHDQDLVSIMTKVNSKMAETFKTYPSMSDMSNNTLRSKFFFAVDENKKKDKSGLCLLTHHWSKWMRRKIKQILGFVFSQIKSILTLFHVGGGWKNPPHQFFFNYFFCNNRIDLKILDFLSYTYMHLMQMKISKNFNYSRLDNHPKLTEICKNG